jgi:hypothetical protein
LLNGYFFLETFRFGAALRVVFFAVDFFAVDFFATFRFGAAFLATFRFGAAFLVAALRVAFFFTAMFLKRVTCNIKLDHYSSIIIHLQLAYNDKKIYLWKTFLFFKFYFLKKTFCKNIFHTQKIIFTKKHRTFLCIFNFANTCKHTTKNKY